MAKTAQGTTSLTQRSTNAQSAVIYDVLSEGPIEGLVSGVSSIRLNDNPVANTSNEGVIGPRKSTDANYNATSGTITDNRSSNMFSDVFTTQGTRFVQIFGGKKQTANSINATAGNNIIISTNTSNMSFDSTDIATESRGKPQQYIRIDGAGESGGQLVAGITEVINTTAVKIDLTPSTTVTNTGAYIDLVDDVASYSANTCTISPTGQGVTTANTTVILSSPVRNSNDQPTYNYQNFGFAFRTGERDQAFLPTPAGIGSASVAHNVSGGDLGTTSGTGYPSPSALGLEYPTEAYTGSALIVTSSTMGIGNPSEIDKLRCTINFPQLISQRDTGAIGPGFAEYRITFGYSRDGGSSYTDVVKAGRETISGQYHGNAAPKSASSGIIRRETVSPFNHVFEFDISRHQPFDSYRVKFERISVVNQKENGWQQQNSGTIQSIENIITDKLSYPYSAFGAVVVDAEDFQQIPKRSYLIRGLKVKVPTNYFPADTIDTDTGLRRTVASYKRNVTTGAEESSVQTWDGNFRGDQKEFPNAADVNHEAVYCNNPVWVFMDLLTNTRYGVGKYLNEDFDFSMIDKYSLFQLAKYCDELVPDGKGGTEPRFTCNLYITKDDTALKILQNLASMLRGMLIWHSGQVTLGSNIQKGAIYTFTKANVLDGTFSYAGTANRFRNNQVAVSWNNPENGYKQEVEVVEDHDEISRTGKIRRKNITAYGTTSRGQAIRLGKYQLLTEKLEKETISFSTSLNASMLKPGDVIDVQDPDIHDVVASGRVTTSSASNTTFIKTDRDITSFLDGTNIFKLHLIYPSGGCYLSQSSATINSVDYVQGDLILQNADAVNITSQVLASNLVDDSGNTVSAIWSDDVRVETQTVDYANTDSTGIAVDNAFTSAPNGEVIFTVSGQNASGAEVTGSLKQYIILSIKEDTKNMQYGITAADYHVEKFDEVDRGFVIPELPDIKRLPQRDDQVPAPSGVTVSIIKGDGVGGDSLTASADSGETSYSIVVSWTHPTTPRTDSEGNTINDVYEHLAGYNIQHNVITENQDLSVGEFVTEELRTTTKTEFIIRNVVPRDEYIVRIQTVNTNGYTSGYLQRKVDFTSEHSSPFTSSIVAGGLTGGIQKGGILSTVPNINSANGLVTFANSSYAFTPPNGVESITVDSGNTNFTQESFSALGNGETAYLLFDYDGSLSRGATREDPLRPIILANDTTAADPSTGAEYNYIFFSRLGQANNDLTAANGTITTTAGDPTVTGTSTTFTSDFRAGDIVALDDAGADRFMTKVGYIESDTSMTLQSAIPHDYSGVNIYRQQLRIDLSRDTIIGEIKNTAGTFTYTGFTNKMKVDTSDEIGGNTITSVQITGNAVTSASIAANSIGSLQITGNAITSSEIAANSIGSAAIVAGSIGSSEIAANSIGSAAIIAGSIGSSEIAANSIGSVAISSNAITSSQISANSIGSAAIVAGSIGFNEIAANSIGSVAITANAVTSSEIASNSIGTVAIQANSITSTQLTANAVAAFTVTANSITAVEIASGTITNALMAANSISAIEISANSIGSAEIAANSVNGTIILGNAVGSSEIAANSVNGIIISSGAIDSATKLAANVINTAAIISGAVDTSQLATDAITAAKIATNAVGSDAIAANAIGSSEIATNSVSAINMVAGSIDSSHISANSIGTTAIVAGAIDSSHISANSITTNMIVSDAIDNSHISANSIDSNMIIAGTIDSSHIGANSITAAAIVAGTITNSEIAGNTINSAVIQAGAVTNPQIGANAITSAKIAAGNVGTAEIAAGAVTNAKIGANAITAAKITAGTITNAEISASAGITFAKISVADGDIDGAKISSNGNITNAMIGSVATSKLTGTITNAQIAANAITAAKIAANSIDTAEIVSGSIDDVHITAVGTGKLSGTISNAQIAANAITSAKIAAGNVGESEIAANAITTAKIAANQITTATIAANQITELTIAANAVGAAQISAIRSEKIDVDTLNVKQFADTSSKIISHLTAGTKFDLGRDGQAYVQRTGTYTGSNAAFIPVTITDVRNNAGYVAIFSGVLGDVSGGRVQYSLNNSTWVNANGNTNIFWSAGTYRGYTYVYTGQITTLSTSQSTVYWRVYFSGAYNHTQLSLNVMMDNTR